MDVILEEVPNVSKLSDAKSAIFQTFNELRKWRENQLQRFRERQLMEQHSLSQESGKKLEQFFENNKGVLLKGKDYASDSTVAASESTLQDSSLSGHILRCFSDSSHDDSAFFQSKIRGGGGTSKLNDNGGSTVPKSNVIPENTPESLAISEESSSSKRQKKPFLRKRSGLTRYAPKQKTDLNEPHQPKIVPEPLVQQASTYQPKATWKLKPAIVKTSSPPRKVNRVQFKEPILIFGHENSQPLSNVTSPLCEDGIKNGPELSDKMVEKTEPLYDDLNVEKKELDEFEMLENFAQNSSFNSDSSVVQRVLLGEPIKPLQQNLLSTLPSNANYINSESTGEMASNTVPVLQSNFNLDIPVEDIPSRKKHLQNFISDINSKIASLQKEVSNSNNINYESSEGDIDNICSTPVKSKKSVEPTSDVSDSETSLNLPLNSISTAPKEKLADLNERSNIKDGDDKCAGNSKPLEYANNEEKYQEDEFHESPISKSLLRRKMQELEKEIQNYQTENAHLASLSKERDEILKKLKKEYDEIQKYKDEEKKKLQNEIENERRHLKRQKETFNRYQKLRSDNPSRKEREEIVALRQEVEKLQEELKKQRIRFNNDTRRLKNQLMAAEKERDGLKVENITLEDQVQDLLEILKGRKTRKKNLGSQTLTKTEENTENKELSSLQDINELESSSLTLKGTLCSSDKISSGNSAKSRVRFNLAPEYNSKEDKTIELEVLNDRGDGITTEPNTLLNDVNKNSINEALPYKETNHGGKVERVYPSGEKEIVFPSGTVKHISADGKTVKVLYNNGDIKEIYPDKRQVYRYVNGVIEKHFPYGLEVTVFPDGQIQKLHPDGLKEVKFPDGTVHFIHLNGSQEILANDGIMVRLDPDGTETIEFPNGEKEIRKDDYKRREYPDGSIKTIYESGRQESRYANGRIRIKDKNGKLIVDTKSLKGLAGST